MKPITGRPKQPMEQRFWKLVIKGDTCWTVKCGRYGKIKGPPPQKETFLAHRYSWLLHYGPIPPGKLVCHRCNNKRCVRPDHLYLADQKTNIADAIRDGLKKSWRGLNNPKAKTPPEIVKSIRLLKSDPVSHAELARRFDVSPDIVRRIRIGENWTYA